MSLPVSVVIVTAAATAAVTLRFIQTDNSFQGHDYCIYFTHCFFFANFGAVFSACVMAVVNHWIFAMYIHFHALNALQKGDHKFKQIFSFPFEF